MVNNNNNNSYDHHNNNNNNNNVNHGDAKAKPQQQQQPNDDHPHGAENGVLPPSTSQPAAEPAKAESKQTPKDEKDTKAAKEKAKSIIHLASPNFVPTEDWLQSWRNQLPISTIIRLLGAVIPQIPTLVNGSSGDESTILAYLKQTTMVGLLPVPHPILIRRYQNNAATNMWFTTFMWGVIYLRNHTPPAFYGTHVKLFIIKMLDTDT